MNRILTPVGTINPSRPLVSARAARGWTAISFTRLGLSSLGTLEDPNGRLDPLGTVTEDSTGMISVPLLSGWTGTDPSAGVWWGFPIGGLAGGSIVAASGGLTDGPGKDHLVEINYLLQLVDPIPALTDVVVLVSTASSRGMASTINRQFVQGIRTGLAGTPGGARFSNSSGGWTSSFGAANASIRGAHLCHEFYGQAGCGLRHGLLDINNDPLTGLRFGSASDISANGTLGGTGLFYTLISITALAAPPSDFTINFRLWTSLATVTTSESHI